MRVGGVVVDPPGGELVVSISTAQSSFVVVAPLANLYSGFGAREKYPKPVSYSIENMGYSAPLQARFPRKSGFLRKFFRPEFAFTSLDGRRDGTS